MEENQKKLQKSLTHVVNVVEQEDIYENLIFVEFVLEKKQMHENFLGWENQVGKNLKSLV